MKEESLTPWFPAEVKPVHVGVYPVKFSLCGEGFSHWNGKKWGFAMNTPAQAKKSPGNRAYAEQRKEWRGLRSKP